MQSDCPRVTRYLDSAPIQCARDRNARHRIIRERCLEILHVRRRELGEGSKYWATLHNVHALLRTYLIGKAHHPIGYRVSGSFSRLCVWRRVQDDIPDEANRRRFPRIPELGKLRLHSLRIHDAAIIVARHGQSRLVLVEPFGVLKDARLGAFDIELDIIDTLKLVRVA